MVLALTLSGWALFLGSFIALAQELSHNKLTMYVKRTCNNTWVLTCLLNLNVGARGIVCM